MIINVTASASMDKNANDVPDECERELFHRGDPNNDGDMDVSDAIFLLRFLYLDSIEPACLESADVNNDGLIELQDSINILNFVFKGNVQFADPGPLFRSCGPDSDDPGSPAHLGCEAYDHCL
ncbi:MAG: hypothetical protein HY717_16725 [Planctomycetes bacterium]|nr:hypothetical protein [Planctomycetota bacterium]